MNTVVKCSSLHSLNSITSRNILEITGSLTRFVVKDLMKREFTSNMLAYTNQLTFVHGFPIQRTTFSCDECIKEFNHKKRLKRFTCTDDLIN